MSTSTTRYASVFPRRHPVRARSPLPTDAWRWTAGPSSPAVAEPDEVGDGRDHRLLGAGHEGTLLQGTEEEHEPVGNSLPPEEAQHLLEEILAMVYPCDKDPAHPGRRILHACHQPRRRPFPGFAPGDLLILRIRNKG
jgi:hypothetical protein